MKQTIYTELFDREEKIYSDIGKERRNRKILIVLFFVALVLTILADMLIRPSEPIKPISTLDEAQTVELQSYHSDKGLVTSDNGFIVIKK